MYTIFFRALHKHHPDAGIRGTAPVQLKCVELIYVLRVCCVLLFSSTPLAVHSAGLDVTALDRYVAAPDSHYEYHVTATLKGEGYTTFIVDMISQQWLTEKEVNLPIWEHVMTVTKPDAVNSDIGLLFIAGGDKLNPTREAAASYEIQMALETRSVVTTLYMVPNQPLVFVGDESISRYEDASIAYVWDKYLRTGDDAWLIRPPMTKAAVRAMDTVTDLLASDEGGNFKVDQFVVAGASKRGWTTWTVAAVDNRVVAIAPLVIDMLNLEASFKHHFEVYGLYADAVGDYTAMGILNWVDTPEFAEIMRITDPYAYRDRLALPKFLLNSTGDQFFLPDSWQFYWNDLVGDKHLRYVPNSDHNITHETDALDSLRAWYHAIVNNVSMPRYSWNVAQDGVITVLSLDRPSKVLLWQAHNSDARNFMKQNIGNAYESSQLQEVEPGKYVAKVEVPETGYTVYYVEMSYPSGISVPFKFSTGTKVLPDTVNYQWQKASNANRMEIPPHL